MEAEDQSVQTRTPSACGDSLQKEISRREAFERKNAELERVNDELRLENGVSQFSSHLVCYTMIESSGMATIAIAIYFHTTMCKRVKGV